MCNSSADKIHGAFPGPSGSDLAPFTKGGAIAFVLALRDALPPRQPPTARTAAHRAPVPCRWERRRLEC
jgi:hypothetical protein